MILAEDTTMIPLNCKLRLLPSHSGLLMPLNQLAKELLFWLGGSILVTRRNWVTTPQ